MATDISTYRMDWKLTDYLDVLLVLKGHPFVYFTSGKSPYWISAGGWRNIRKPAILSRGRHVHPYGQNELQFVPYTDIMLYKEMTEAA